MAGDDDFALLIFAGRQIAADENLLRAGRQIRQAIRIDGRDLQPAELDLQIAQSRLRRFP